MKPIIAASIVLLSVSPTFAADTSADAQKELAGWGRAALEYEERCEAGKLRDQMPPEKANDAYQCFAGIMDDEVEPHLQHPDLYETLDNKMETAHADYAAGMSDWPETLTRLGAASDEYNTAVAARNAQNSTND